MNEVTTLLFMHMSPKNIHQGRGLGRGGWREQKRDSHRERERQEQEEGREGE